MDHQDYEVLGRKRGKFNPQIYLNKKVYEIDNAQLKQMQQMDLHEVSKLVQRILKKAIANRENDDVTVLLFYFKDLDYIQKLQNKFDEQTFLQVISHITYKKYQKNELVCKQGQVEKQMYFLLEGKACVKKYDVVEYEKKDGTFGIRKICLIKKTLSKGDSFCNEIIKGSNYDEVKYCSYSVSNLDQMLECAVLRRDHYLGFKISMEIKQEINKVNLIQSSCIFNYHLNPRQLKSLSSNFYLKKASCNNIIYSEGDEADGIYIIKSGRFKIQKSTSYNYNFEDLKVNNFKIAQSKKYSEIAVLGEGQCFGDEEIFKNYDKRIFTVSCETAIGEYFQISKKDFFRVLSQQFKEEDWKELENAFQLKNDWRKENIAQIQKVKQKFVEYMGAPPKYSCEAKLLKLTMSNKKQISPKNERSSSPVSKEVLNTQSNSLNEPQKTFELTQINNQEQNQAKYQASSTQITPTSNRYQKKTDQYLQQKDLPNSRTKIDTDYGFYRKNGVKSSLGNNDEVETRHNTSTSISNSTSKQFLGNQLRLRNEVLPRNTRSQSVQDENNLVKIGQMFKSGGNNSFLPVNISRGNSPYIQNQYPHQKELILPEINYKEHSTIDIRFRHPSPFSRRYNPNNTNGKTQYKYGFGSGMQSPIDHTSIQYYDGSSNKKKRNYNQAGSIAQTTNRSNSSMQYQEGEMNNQSPYRFDEFSNNLAAINYKSDNKFQIPLRRMDIADITYNKAIILKTKNFTTEEEKGKVIAFEGFHFLPTELDNNYLEKKGIIKKKIDPKKREIENQQSMEKGKKILENFILGYLIKKKRAQSSKKQNKNQPDNPDEVAQVQMYSFPQGKTNTQFYGKSKKKLKKRIHTNIYNEDALSPQPVPKNITNAQIYNLDYHQQTTKQIQQLQFSPIQAKQSLKENSNNIPFITLEKSPTKLSIQQDSIKSKIIQENIIIDQPKKPSQKSIFTGKTFNQRKNSKQMTEL